MIYIALPVLNESEQISCFLEDLRKQQKSAFHLVVCVNQYDHWWGDALLRAQCEDNQKTLGILQSVKDIPIDIIDNSSSGKGWPKKKGGVGWARKTAMDYIAEKASDDDIIVSMDADTGYPEDFLMKVRKYFELNPEKWGLAIPYYHQLTGDDEHDRLMLRYELYMRNYLLNLLRIENPYAFTALGSAMAFPVWAYRKVIGLTPVLSGEDFYFLQKLVKYGDVGLSVSTTVFPSARFSDRVLFGTGPALIRGKGGDWSAYPFYPASLFDEVRDAFQLFRVLFEKDVATPMDDFLFEQFKTKEIWNPMRKNYKKADHFVRACENKVDGLRILQFLRYRMPSVSQHEEEVLINLIRYYEPDSVTESCLADLEKGFWKTSIDCLQQLRDRLFRIEAEQRKIKG